MELDEGAAADKWIISSVALEVFDDKSFLFQNTFPGSENRGKITY